MRGQDDVDPGEGDSTPASPVLLLSTYACLAVTAVMLTNIGVCLAKTTALQALIADGILHPRVGRADLVRVASRDWGSWLLNAAVLSVPTSLVIGFWASRLARARNRGPLPPSTVRYLVGFAIRVVNLVAPYLLLRRQPLAADSGGEPRSDEWLKMWLGSFGIGYALQLSAACAFALTPRSLRHLDLSFYGLLFLAASAILAGHVIPTMTLWVTPREESQRILVAIAKGGFVVIGAVVLVATFMLA